MADATRAPPDERGGNRQAKPKTTAPHPYSIDFLGSVYADSRPKPVIRVPILSDCLTSMSGHFWHTQQYFVDQGAYSRF
jgi:hypothetical protein